ncbi:hypothetical protein GCM10023166_23380 [Paeniglutamicibacter cryotolerans]
MARRRAEQMSHRVWVDVEPGAPRHVMSVLEHALIEQVSININYLDAGGTPTRREVEPMIFAFSGGRWLLVAWCRLRGAIRWFRFSRIHRATATRNPCAGHDIADIGEPPASARSVR